MEPVQDIGQVRFLNRAGLKPAAHALRAMVEGRLPGWRVAPCANLAARQPMMDDEGEPLATSVFGWTEDEDEPWWRASRLALDSPLAQACRFESEPFWCNALGFHPLLRNPLLDRINIGDFERRAMAGAAIVVPVHMPLGVIGAASLLPPDRRMVDLTQAFDSHADALAGAVRAFIASYARVMGTANPMGSEGAPLSKREVECLRWAAVGKTNAEIGMIMSRSLATVRFHLHNATTKLNAVNRSQAVFKATQLGYLRS